MAHSMVDILFDDVCYSYDGETDVLRHVSLSIERGEYIAILGLSLIHI